MSNRIRPLIALSVVAAVAVWVVSPSSALLVTDSTAATVQQAGPLTECFADGWTDELLQEEALELSGAKPCRPCQGREWCTCSNNGAPRISCDPCCYQQYGGQIVCLD